MGAYRPDGWRRYWLWYGLAVVLLIVVDLMSTYAAVRVYGLAGEANPVMRWLLEQGPLMTILVHAVVLVVCTIGFWAVIRIGDGLDGPSRHRYRLVCEWWLILLVVAGAIVVGNNITLVLLA